MVDQPVEVRLVLRGVPVAALLAACLLAGGCLGPEAVKRTRIRYNEAYRSTNDEQLLLNIVRLRYADSPIFIDLPNITSQFEATARGSYSGGLDGQGPGRTQLGVAELFLRDAPTLSYHPREGQEIGRALISPLTAELLRVVSPGSNTEQFLLMAVNDINDVPNAPLATSLAPKTPDHNILFRHGVALIAALQARGAIELGMASYDTDTFDSIPVQQVRGEDALEAVKAGYVFRTTGDRAVLKKREKSVILKVRPEEVDSFEMRELARVFGLTPGQAVYKVKSEQAEEDQADGLPSPLGGDTILLNMRSLLQTMVFLSKGVHIPEEHARGGIAPNTPGADGCPYDWTRVTAGLFQVRSQKHRPKAAEVSVKYRGYWFWIDASDVNSRAVLAIVELLFALQESEREQLGPVLTLPLR
jgi:hypothetical protein